MKHIIKLTLLFTLIFVGCSDDSSNGPDTGSPTFRLKINGANWQSTNQYLKRSIFDYSHIAKHDFDGSEYEIIISYNYVNIAVGTYNFTSSDATNKVEVAKYDSVTGITTIYNSTGTLTITKRTNGIITGTYSFTAVNPNNGSDVIQVTDGAVKFVHYDV